MLALLVIAPAAMAYPWRTTDGRWVVGIAAVVVIALLCWWRGLHASTILWRRVALLGGGSRREPDTHAITTAVLRILPERTGGLTPDLPLPLIAEYLDRYGIRCDAVRVTSRDTPVGRATWIGLTISAAANLAALRARSADIPLRETAVIAVRRLADHLREYGWTVTTSDIDVPDLLGPDLTERWRAVQDGNHGYVAAYEVAAGAALTAVLSELWSYPSPEVWTSLQITRSGGDLAVAVACAVRTDDMPAAAAPLSGLIAQRGKQRSALAALAPSSTELLAGQPISGGVLSELHWHVHRVPALR
jgi:type VII secretion protein EccE